MHLVRDPLPEAAPRAGVAGPLVVGVGREGRRDDAAGLRAARLARALLWPRGRVVECEGATTSLLDAWRGADTVIVVDAMVSGAPPGTVRRLDTAREALPAVLYRGSTHGLGLAEAVELARSLGQSPRSLVIYGIEGEDFGFGPRLSYVVECAVRDAALRIVEDIQRLETAAG
jgi:hydrogenase maturation protease